MTAYRLFGLKNCDRCRAAHNWLASHQIPLEFVDIRDPVPSEKTLACWIGRVGLVALINRASTTWRNLSEAERQRLDSADAVAFLRLYPTLIKRPVLEKGDTLVIGFKPDLYSRTLL